MRSIRDVFQDLIDGLEVAHDVVGLTSAADRTARRLGFRWFAYLGSAGLEVTIISSYPKTWVQHYRQQRFDRIDPVVRPAHSRRQAFYWDGEVDGRRSPAEQRLFNEARDFDIHCGVTVPILIGADRFAAFTFAGDEQHDELKSYATEEIDTLQLMGLYYHAHVYAKVHLGLNRVQDAPLSPRECQCLTWAARGKTMADTSQILGIKKRTVEFHIDNARAKLNALTVSQAVAEAVRRELLPPR